MIRLRIDSVVCDLAAEQPLTLAWSGRTLTDPEAGRSGEALTFELLPTAAAEALFGAECHLYGAGRFNAALHRGELLAGGTPLASGSVRLVETLWHGTEHRYRVELRGGAHAWAEQAAKEWFRELEVAYEGRLLPTEIAAGWSDDSPVKFLPVYRDRYEIENGDAGLRPPERLLSTDDYHPFLSIRALVQALFAKAGYTVESAFMESPWFRSLYMSGAYASHDTRVRQQKMGFLARRKADRTTTANALGRVEANPFVTHNTVGNLVDAFSPQAVDETGVTLTDAYSAGGCLRIEEGELCFRPLTEVSVGIEYELRYTTDYRIRSRTRLTGFDSVWLGEDADVRFELANRFEDRREALRPSFQYRIVVFDHTEGNRWTLRCTTDGAETTLAAFHFTGDAETEGFTLCFEDRDAQEGLHRFYDARIAAEEDRQQVTLRLRIAPDEYAALFRFAGEAHPTIRSRFRFRFAGGSSLFTLRAVEAYDPREGVAHCTFDRLCDD